MQKLKTAMVVDFVQQRETFKKLLQQERFLVMYFENKTYMPNFSVFSLYATLQFHFFNILIIFLIMMGSFDNRAKLL